jgi:hypothetical protein
MTRIETIQTLLGIKDTVYGLLEWVENISDEEFVKQCTVSRTLPGEVLMRLEDFGRLSGGFNADCDEILNKVNQLCSATDSAQGSVGNTP